MSVKKGVEIRFNDVLDTKQTFFVYKNKIIQSLKKAFFHAFGQNMQFFSFYLFSVKKEHEIRFNNVLNRKETFFDYKNKNGILPKGLTHAFSKKMQFFLLFFFR